MSFKTKRIRYRPSRKPFKKAKTLGLGFVQMLKNLPPKTKNYIVSGALMLFGALVVLKVTTAAYHFVANFSITDIISIVGADLDKDEHEYTNILILGDGGHVRDGADLIDTIMVASIDYEKNAVSLLSIPRDFYIKADTELGVNYSARINELYRNHKDGEDGEDGEEGGYQVFKKAAGDVVDLDIQYYVRMDFNAFVEVIDSLGGITVDVQEDIYDPYYPNETDTGYTIFSIEKGLQEMDGETALKFVRSRKTTSDFDRAGRQQLVLDAIQQKALSKEMFSAEKIKKVYGAVKDNVNTDMSIREMISLAGFAKQMDRSKMVRKVMHDDPGQEGGFLYTPERELYGGRFVLVPFGNDYELIHKYADLIFHQREIFFDPPKIEILNATKFSGIARSAAYQLNRFGFNIESIDNYYDDDGEKAYLGESLIEYYNYTKEEDGLVRPKHQSTLQALDGFVKGIEEASLDSFLSVNEEGRQVYEGGKIDISIILGDDYDVFLVK